MTLEDAPDLLKPAEAAKILRVGRNQLYAALQAGEIPAIRLGRSIRIPKAGLERLLAGKAEPA